MKSRLPDISSFLSFPTWICPSRRAFAFATMLIGSSITTAAPVFLGLGLSSNPENVAVSVSDISDDGLTIVGTRYALRQSSYPGFPIQYTQAFRWTQVDGMKSIGDLPVFFGLQSLGSSKAYGVSADGNTIVGVIDEGQAPKRSFRWTADGGMQELEFPAGVPLAQSSATAVSADGNTVLGSVPFGAGTAQSSFVWTSNNGVQIIGFKTDTENPSHYDYYQTSTGISADGSLVVGTYGTPGRSESAYRWTPETGFEDIDRYESSFVTNVSGNGNVLIGRKGGPNRANHAFFWTEGTGFTYLQENRDSYNQSIARDASFDGQTIVGSVVRGGAFAWSSINGFQNIQELLENDFGMNLNGWYLEEAVAISGDGLTIVGNGRNPDGKKDGWLVRLDGNKLEEVTTLALARLSDAVYEQNTPYPVNGAATFSPYRLIGIKTELVQLSDGVFVGKDGFRANVYRDIESGQIVISVRGTDLGDDALYNLLADSSFAPNGKANILLKSYVKQLAELVISVNSEIPAAAITLTGHSLGGAVAQIVGKSANIAVTSFDAPGSSGVYSTLLKELPDLGGLSSIHILSPSRQIVNYRMAGDQISLIGAERDGYSDSQLGATVSVTNPDSNVTMTWGDVLRNHNMTSLANQIEIHCPSGISGRTDCISGYSNEKNITINLIKGAAAVCNTFSSIVSKFPVSCVKMVFPAVAYVVSWLDPSPGHSYSIQVGTGSPLIRGIELPTLAEVPAWRLRYHDQFGWSSFFDVLGNQLFDLGTEANAVDFFPVDRFGDPIYNNEYFAYGLSFATDGDVSLAQATQLAVPEPGTLLLVVSAGFTLAFLRRRVRGWAQIG